MTRKEAWDMVVSGVKECAEYAKQKNMTISVEILQGTLINSVDQWFKLYNEVGMDNVYVTVDTGTFYTTVKPKMPIPEAIRKLGKHINCVHVKDEVGFPNIIQSQHVWYGGGYVDFREIGECLKEVGYDGYCAVEWEGWQNGGLLGVAIRAAWALRTSVWSRPKRSCSWRTRAGAEHRPLVKEESSP